MAPVEVYLMVIVVAGMVCWRTFVLTAWMSKERHIYTEIAKSNVTGCSKQHDTRVHPHLTNLKQGFEDVFKKSVLVLDA